MRTNLLLLVTVVLFAGCGEAFRDDRADAYFNRGIVYDEKGDPGRGAHRQVSSVSYVEEQPHGEKPNQRGAATAKETAAIRGTVATSV